MGVPEVQDILLRIFEVLFAQPSEDGYPDLAALARTCRSFYHPAVSILWRTQSSLVPLVFTFPPELLETSDIVTGGKRFEVVRFTKLPCMQDWERPLQYAELIKTIARLNRPIPRVMWRIDEYMLHSSVLDKLVKSCPVLQVPLFRRLQNLDSEAVSACGRTFVHQETISHSLETAFLLQLSRPAALRDLRFTFGAHWNRDAACVTLAQLVERYATVESLTVEGHTDMQIFDYLVPIGSLENLTAFSLHIRPFLSSDLPPKMGITLFPILRDISLVCSGSCAVQVLKVIHSPNLKEISLSNFSGHENIDDSISTYITSRPSWRQSLQSIRIFGTAVSAQAVESLLNFRHLRLVSLGSPDLNDDILQRMAQAWPALEGLVLTPQPSNRDRGRGTLNSIASFFRHCPHLTSLKIKVDATLIPSLTIASPSDARSGDSREETWKRLLLEISPNSEIQDPAGVAQFLLNLSPNIVLRMPFFTMNLWRSVVKFMGERGEIESPPRRGT